MLARQGSNRRGQRRGHRLGLSIALARLFLPARESHRARHILSTIWARGAGVNVEFFGIFVLLLEPSSITYLRVRRNRSNIIGIDTVYGLICGAINDALCYGVYFTLPCGGRRTIRTLKVAKCDCEHSVL